jgi:hypothetical protein
MKTVSRARYVAAWTIAGALGVTLMEWILLKHEQPVPSLGERIFYGVLVVVAPITGDVIWRRRAQKRQ